jgi:hypothetical protein
LGLIAVHVLAGIAPPTLFFRNCCVGQPDELPGSLLASVGQAVGLRWLPEQAHLFDAQSGLRLVWQASMSHAPTPCRRAGRRRSAASALGHQQHQAQCQQAE